MAEKKTYCVYIMASASGVLYIGVTNDLERRVFEHKKKMVPGFSSRYNVQKLVYFESFNNIRVAIAREKELKGWLRRRKVALIESVNQQWKDLSANRRVGCVVMRPALAPKLKKRDSSLRSE